VISDTTEVLDPVTLEVIRNALPAISDEMSFDLQRTSYNMMIYEVRDYCTALLDTEARLISQNIGGVSHFVADLGVVIKDGIERYGLDGFAPGDVLLHNHQAVAGQHLNNVVVYTPVFHDDGTLVAFAVVRAHWVDVGGLSTGFGAGNAAYDPWSEGLQFDQLKLYEGGVVDEKLLKMIRDNIRFPDAAMGDLRSQLAACRLGGRRFTELLQRYGSDTVMRSIDAIYKETELRCRAVVEQIPDGVYEASAFLGDDNEERYDIHVKVTISGSDMEIDLSGCSPQRDGGINSRTYAGAYIAYKALTVPLSPVNEGSFSALKVVIPEGNMMMARYPAFMAGWSGALPTVVDTVWRALAEALPDRIPAAHSGTLGATFVFFGFDPRRDKSFVVQSIESGGWGGRPYEDGESASMSVCQGDVRNAPIENIELKNPVLVLERALRQDSGGPGKFRGGLGISTRARGLVDGRWAAGGNRGGRTDCAPWGLWGGKDGAIADVLVKRPTDPDFHPSPGGRYAGPVGTEVLYRTAGGGGWGDPLERDPRMVAADVSEGYVSPDAARNEYGVVLAADGSVDDAATTQLRSSLRSGSGSSGVTR
jgi:N-methylhydantoinase B